MGSKLHPEDSANHYRNVSASDDAPLEGDDVVVIQPGSTLGRLGIPQVWKNKYLLKFFILRSIRGRYRPTSMGYGWIIFRPLLLSFVYIGVFGYLVGIETSSVPFPLFVFLGISLYLFFSGTVSDTAASLTSNAGIMSKVYYPRLIIPLTSLFVNIVDLGASFVVVIVLMAIYGILPGWNIVFFPLFIIGFAVSSFALGLILASHSIERKDIMMALPVIMRVMVYAMPCVYPVTMVPEHLIDVYFLNPWASIIQGIRWSLLGDIAPPVWSLWWAGVIMVAGLFYGLVAFIRTERTMVDSL